MKKEVKIGLYALIVLVALYWGINFLRGRDIFSRDNVYYAEYEQVSGLQKSSAVTAKGVKIGTVSDISYDPSVSPNVRIELSVNSKFRVPDNSQARVYSGSLMGGKEIEIIIGNSPVFLKDGDKLHSYIDPGLLETAGSELSDLSAKLSKTADSATKLLSTVTSLLEDNRGSIDGALGNLNTVSAALAAETGTLHNTLSNVEKLSADLAASDLDGTLGNINRFSANLAEVDLIKLNQSLTSLNSILADIDCGRGTLGKLSADDSLYNALTDASANLSLLLEDLKAHPSRYVNFSVFGGKK